MDTVQYDVIFKHFYLTVCEFYMSVNLWFHKIGFRYVYKLHDLHVPVGNFTEAAFTLKLHADDLEWASRTLHADLRFAAVAI
jgi:hypothetical protein